MTDNHTSTCCAGIDVSKSKLDVALWPGGEHRVFDYTAEGLRQLSGFLASRQVSRIGFEASGGYERRLLEHLRAGAIAAARLQPAQVKSFARSRLQRAKNDRLDAMLIAAFTAQLDRLPDLPDELTLELAEHLTFIEQIEDQMVTVRTSLATTANPRLRRLHAAEIRRLEARREAELLCLAKAVQACEERNRRLVLLCSIKGIGLRSALAFLIRLPELGRLSREEVAALTGVAPFDRDSGTTSGRRPVQGGRPRLRKSVFMAAFAACQWNPDLKTFYKRLRAKGKHHLTALVAVMRKLVILANAVIARNSEWTPTPP